MLHEEKSMEYVLYPHIHRVFHSFVRNEALQTLAILLFPGIWEKCLFLFVCVL